MRLVGLTTPEAEAQELLLEIILSTSIDFSFKEGTRRQCAEEPRS